VGYQIGHSFFVPSKDVAAPLDASWYRRVIRNEIAPLLEEYWFDHVEKAESWTAKLLDGVS
jgi:5-methylcytosine-specific restriction protein B